jgi:hypothetical protein
MNKPPKEGSYVWARTINAGLFSVRRARVILNSGHHTYVRAGDRIYVVSACNIYEDAFLENYI